MKRLALCMVTALLTWGAFATQPSQACPTTDFCDDAACRSSCIAQGYPLGGACIGRPCTVHFCSCLEP
jgi:hypothetical protein